MDRPLSFAALVTLVGILTKLVNHLLGGDTAFDHVIDVTVLLAIEQACRSSGEGSDTQ